MKKIIFTDMDGTLLDHQTYSYDFALEMLVYIGEKNIPLILITSKTSKEVIIWQEKLGIIEPFICENGAALFIPDGYRNFDMSLYPLKDGYRIVCLGKEYKFITTYIDSIKDKYKIKGFNDMKIEEIMVLTGLNKQNAGLAKQREFSEPFVIEDELQVRLLEKEASMYGLKITKGGRFFHCIGVNQDKGKALEIASAIFRRNGYESKSIALGDGKNDESMLSAADIAIQIPSHDKSFVNMNIKNIIKAKYPGPKGWADSLRGIL